jgi:hypothetical protein
MGLFSRRTKREAEDTDSRVGTDAAPEAGSEADTGIGTDTEDTDTPAPGDATGHASGPAAAARPEHDHLDGGPFDAGSAPEAERIDLGGLQIPRTDDLELRMEVEQRSNAVTGATLVLDGSALQVQAFAAPRSRGLWDEVRSSLRDSVVSQGGTAETRQGPFGTELIARLPLRRADGRTGYRPARFIGVDGPRWFVRAILSGPALGDLEAARRFETLLSQVVVVRGHEAMAPQELIPLHLPGQRPGAPGTSEDPLDPLGRGPEITEVG